ncbi:hypothetical protein FJ420_11730 [Mesorhizobium sp. B3-1-3]|uniref:hypothetical protein n=1 Tax=unclassified Mesorhizobium TaxID=325217 RepID=UPI001129F476|nr:MULTISPECIES: hypothetical protein [unclassified Mesorhizobium]TPI65541.1 hypothetical protein FJ424_16170 [Mesorhizobium sp. B3-1-8]TPI72736.1 hypothetical protein FJ420_11730 [Mesorhizobium sp. B3-1-3]
MRVLSTVLAFVLLASEAFAFGNDDHWVSGSGQGFDEAIITHGPGNEILVTCNRGATDPGGTGITIKIGGREINGPLTMLFDGSKSVSPYTGVITTDNRAGISWYQEVMKQLVSSRSVMVVIPSIAPVRFSLRGAKKAIGTPCAPDLWR